MGPSSASFEKEKGYTHAFINFHSSGTFRDYSKVLTKQCEAIRSSIEFLIAIFGPGYKIRHDQYPLFFEQVEKEAQLFHEDQALVKGYVAVPSSGEQNKNSKYSEEC